jgi:glycosyltransferase involved in cell wall biosynthesis
MGISANKLSFITPQDQNFAISQWQIPAENCLEIPYGIIQGSYPKDRAEARQKICSKHSLAADTKILLFNGPLDYAPNWEALQVILKKINPLLQKNNTPNYKLIICGKGLPKKMKLLKEYEKDNILYAGFVEDIDTYVKGANLLLNPIQKGGGVKTKVIEAIGSGTPVVSTATGAIGVDQKAAGNMLTIIADHDWVSFATTVKQQIATPLEQTPITPESFYEKYNWEAILNRVIPMLSN